MVVCRQAARGLHEARGGQFVWVMYGGLGFTKQRKEPEKQLQLALTMGPTKNKKKVTIPQVVILASRRALFKRREKNLEERQRGGNSFKIVLFKVLTMAPCEEKGSRGFRIVLPV